MTRKNLSQKIHKSDPYDGFDFNSYGLDLQGWGSNHAIFENAITQLRPNLIIEVGTWKGGSAIHMANLVKKIGCETEIICVDTFLGSTEHWENEIFYKSLNHKNGYPTLYYQFLANVCLTGNQDIITPFPISSINAAHYFKHAGILADIVYIDAGHEYEDVIRDIKMFWDILRPGGVMIGDDFAANWHGVVRAVSEFAEQKNLPVRYSGTKFIFQK